MATRRVAQGVGADECERGVRAAAVPHCVRRTQKQGCRRQPCLLSIFDGLKPIQSGFFGFLGFFFPKKNPKWGAGRSPAYISSRSGGMGRSPIYNSPSVGVRGAEPHKNRSSCRGAGRGAPHISSPLRGDVPQGAHPLIFRIRLYRQTPYTAVWTCRRRRARSKYRAGFLASPQDCRRSSSRSAQRSPCRSR